MLYLIKCLFSIYWKYVFILIYVLYNVDWFPGSEPLLHLRICSLLEQFDAWLDPISNTMIKILFVNLWD